ncbi:MAG: DUF1284 domain-containing protein [Oscillospiraceae bacterium]|nr:DUF1284 domain-containing protein [Oscillospiraceae bacterium]
MKLRPHHLLCIQKFIGRGYDDAFTAHMTAVCSSLHEQPDMPVTLTAGCDDVCAACPHKAGSKCDAAEKVQALDRAVLEHCDLRVGMNADWSSLKKLVSAKIFHTDAFAAVCGGCQWYGLCRDMEET